MSRISSPTREVRIPNRELIYTQGTPSKEASNIIINDLKSQISEKERKIKEAEGIINQLKQRIESIRSSRSIDEKDKDIRIKSLEENLAKVNSDYTSERGVLSKKISEYQTLIESLKKGKSALDSKHAKTVSERNKCLKEQSETKLLLNESREELQKVKSQLTTLSKELAVEKSKKSTEVINNRRINELEDDIKKLKNTETQLNVYLERLSKEYQKLQQKLEKLESKKAEAEEIIEFQKTALSSANSELKARDSQILERDNRIGLLQKQREVILKKCQGQKDELEKEKERLDLEYKKLLKSSSSYGEKKVVEIQNAKIKLQKELEEKENILKEYQNKYIQIQEEITTLKQDKKLDSSKIQVYERQQEKIVKELSEQLEILKRDSKRTENTLVDIRVKLKSCNEDNKIKNDMIKQLQEEKDALQKEKQECEKNKQVRISKLNTIKLDLEGKLTKISEEKLKADSEIKSLKSQAGFLKQNTEVNKQKLIEDQQQKEEQIKAIEKEIMEQKSEYESRIQGLSLDIDSKEAMISRLKTELKESRASLKTCNSSNEVLKTENEELIIVRNELRDKLTECNKLYIENQKTIKTLQKQKEDVESRLSSQSSGEMDLLESQSSLKEQIKLLESEIIRLNREQETIYYYQDKLEIQLNTCNSSNETLRIEKENLEGRLQASEFSLKTEREESMKLLERINELDIAKKDAEEVNKDIEKDRIELQKGITSKHVEIQRLERELESVKRKLTELENNQGMEESKQNYIQKIQELQSRISGFETEKNQMEKQLEDCTKVLLELSSKINQLEKLVENLKLENEKLKVENDDLVKQVKDREAGSMKLNEKLKAENQKLIKEREMYSSQFQETQKLQADNTRYEEIVKSLQEKLQSEILKNRGEKSVIENEYRQSLETIEELNKQLETSKKLLSENSSKLLQSQQIQASQASQDKIKELENINNLLREEIARISEKLRLKNSEISREGSSRILEIKNEEERLTGILKKLNTEIGFSEHQLRQLQENISKKKDISVVSSFNLSINDEEYDRIQRIIRNVERVTKKCDKLSMSKMSK